MLVKIKKNIIVSKIVIITFLNKIDIKIEKGDVNNSPIQVNESKMKEEESYAKNQINNDKDIQKFIEKFNGKIKKL